MRFHSILALAAVGGLGAMLVQTGTGCTINSTTTTTTDDGGGGGTTDTDSGVLPDGAIADSGVDAGPALGFAPTNLTLTSVAWGNLVDVDLTTSTSIDSDVDDSTSLSSTTGGVAYLTSTQSDGSKIGVYVAKSWKIDAGAIVHAKGAYPIAFVALTTIDIAGTLDASAVGAAPGAGGPLAAAGVDAGTDGGTVTLGTGGAGSQTVGVAAAGGTACGVGGGGGVYTGQVAATLGTVYGTASLSPLVAGSNGGIGTNAGGAGGGAIQLAAGTSLTIEATGAIAANGGGGGHSGSVAVGAIEVGSGGGSGGSLLLESPIVSVTGKLAANGGGGGGNSANDGQDGQISATPASGTGTGSGIGGNGNGGTTLAGTAGMSGSLATGTGNDIPPGGGGGGAGWIRINSKSGVGATLATSALLSPASGTTCVSQGSIVATN